VKEESKLKTKTIKFEHKLRNHNILTKLTDVYNTSCHK